MILIAKQYSREEVLQQLNASKSRTPKNKKDILKLAQKIAMEKHIPAACALEPDKEFKELNQLFLKELESSN